MHKVTKGHKKTLCLTSHKLKRLEITAQKDPLLARRLWLNRTKDATNDYFQN